MCGDVGDGICAIIIWENVWRERDANGIRNDTDDHCLYRKHLLYNIKQRVCDKDRGGGARMSTSVLIAAGACVSLSLSVTPAEYSAVVVVMESAEVHA